MPTGKNLFDTGIYIDHPIIRGISFQEEGPKPDSPKPIQNIDLSLALEFNGDENWITGLSYEKIKEKEKGKVNKYDALLNLYKDKIVGRIDKDSDEKVKKIREEDFIQKTLQETAKKIVKYLNEKEKDTQYIENVAEIITDIKLITSETLEKIDKIEEENYNFKAELDEKLKEVKARLAMTDEYDTQIKILKDYGVLNKDGKLNV